MKYMIDKVHCEMTAIPTTDTDTFFDDWTIHIGLVANSIPELFEKLSSELSLPMLNDIDFWNFSLTDEKFVSRPIMCNEETKLPDKNEIALHKEGKLRLYHLKLCTEVYEGVKSSEIQSLWNKSVGN